jgi:MHS family proline/betaine transporter-like MFS transporter
VSGVALSYNLCWGLLGGTAPTIVTSLLAWSHDALAPAYYLMAAAVVSLGALLRWRDTTQAPRP